MNDETTNTEFHIPQGSLEVRQSHWAWLWGLLPWLILAIVLVALDAGSGLFIFAIVLGVAVAIPRFLMWRRTAYYVTHDGVVFQRGLIGTPQHYQLPAESFRRISSRPGMFGKLLGYHAIDVRMREGGRVSFAYVRTGTDMLERLEALRDQFSDYDEEQELLELAVIEARQRGEPIPEEFEVQSTAESAQDPQEESPVADSADTTADSPAQPEPGRPPGTSQEAREYRPEVSGYDPRRSGHKDYRT